MKYSIYPSKDLDNCPHKHSTPKNWETRRLKFAATYNDETIPDSTDPDHEIAYVDISSVNLIDGVTSVETMLFDEAPSRARRVVKNGDTVISTVRTYLKAIATIVSPPDNMIVSTGFSVIRPLVFVDSRYMGYALQSTHFVDQVEANSTGVSYPAINPSVLVTIPVIYPIDYTEQQKIADFLDWKTGQIDSLIETKKQLNEKLKEQRLAVITQAVTKGLNPDVPMEDSGIAWLGEIPTHWNSRRLKFSVSKVGSGVTPKGGAESYEDSGIPLLRSQNIHFENMRLDDVVYINAETHESMSNSQVCEGDVLLNITGASIGRCNYAQSNLGEANVSQHVCIIRPEEDLNTQYLFYVLWSDIGQLQVDLEQNGGGREGLNFVAIKNFHLPLPEICDQEQIVKYLEVRTTKIKDLIAKTNQAIEMLEEYRTALITTATSGKIDVRDVEIPTT